LVSDLDPKASAILDEKVLCEAVACRVGVFLVKGVIEAGGELPSLQNISCEQREVGDDVGARIEACQSGSLAYVLKIHAGEDPLLDERHAERALEEMLRRIGDRHLSAGVG